MSDAIDDGRNVEEVGTELEENGVDSQARLQHLRIAGGVPNLSVKKRRKHDVVHDVQQCDEVVFVGVDDVNVQLHKEGVDDVEQRQLNAHPVLVLLESQSRNGDTTPPASQSMLWLTVIRTHRII